MTTMTSIQIATAAAFLTICGFIGNRIGFRCWLPLPGSPPFLVALSKTNPNHEENVGQRAGLPTKLILASRIKAPHQSQSRSPKLLRYRHHGFLPIGHIVESTLLGGIPRKVIGYDVHGLPVLLPLVGAGSWQYNETMVYDSFCKSLHAGYTLLDTAYGYHNQIGVGRAVRDCYLRNNKDRRNLFILTKVPGGLSHAQTLAVHHVNLWQLNVEYVDHLMVHYPADWNVSLASKEQRQTE
jgi:Aldo/keto reductase family